MLLARKIDSGAEWLRAGDWWARGSFPYFLMGELEDASRDGLSVYAVDPTDTLGLARVASDLHVKRNPSDKPKVATFRFVDTSDLDGADIEYKQTPGDNFDGVLKTAHYDLKADTSDKAVRLLDLFSKSQQITITDKQIVTSLANGILNGVYDYKTLRAEQIKILYMQGVWSTEAHK